MIGIGIWAYLEKQKYYNKEIESVYDVIFDLAIIFLVLGAVIFILGYAGCIGALRENVYLLKFVSISKNSHLILSICILTLINFLN